MTIDEQLRALRDIVQVDVGNRGLARDPNDNLFTACPDDFANACRSLTEHSNPHVGIVTGFMIPSVDPPTGETDGPPGALFLAHVLAKLGIRVFLQSDDAGMNALRVARGQVPLIELSKSLKRDEYFPDDLTHLIAIERCGPTHEDGSNRTMRGRDLTDLTAPAHVLFEGPRKYVTIGIGDGGNEIGMGKVPRATIAKNIPNGDTVACRTATDFLIVAGISNWGAYALAAGVMLLREKIDVGFFDPGPELQLLERLVREGPLVDGVTGQRTATVDGLSFAEYAKPLSKIREVLLAQASNLSE
ncbi:MAG: DUF4392 domain-containing protein [Gemmataceae bacterium]|nr:DUF4392 domain-containing protein [Gemmataceae bacterium]